MNETSEWLTVRQAAQESGYTVEYIRDLARKNLIVSKKTFTQWLIDRRSLLEHKERTSASRTG